jgi:GNAT-family acetyltransferase (TIGR03103 family)
MRKEEHYRRRLERQRSASLTGQDSTQPRIGKQADKDAIVDCGWGRLIFAHTFDSEQKLANTLIKETRGNRDIAFYVSSPHLLLASQPQSLFLDPSNTYRLWLDRYHVSALRPRGFTIRLLNSRQDAKEVHKLYKTREMIPPPIDFMWNKRTSRTVLYFVAQDIRSGQILGAATGIDHIEAFNDPERGSSLWALAVDPQARHPGIGQALVRHMAEYFIARGSNYLDLSVMHDNRHAIRLYEHLGFERVNVFAVKTKNSFNEPLYMGEDPKQALNPYARIITREAQRRGIEVKVLDAEAGYFQLSLGGRSLVCRESLSELTSAIAMSRCDNKMVTHRLMSQAGLRVPAQTHVESIQQARLFLQQYGSVVVKPAQGEQGMGISVDIRDADLLQDAIDEAAKYCESVLLEEFVKGQDLRVIVINHQVVAAAIRRPPRIVGNGIDSIRTLIEKQSRRRETATAGESKIPMDQETLRCVTQSGYQLGDTLPYGEYLTVRKTANLHTGGTIHDVTDQLHPGLKKAAINASLAINIPVTGLDLMVPDIKDEKYVIIEANERPGLANHEPQPTAERFVDLLFPETAAYQPGV